MRRLLLAATAVIALCTAGLVASGVWMYSELDKPYFGARLSEVYAEIPHGANANEIATLLADAGILKYKLPFKAYLRFTRRARHIQAGEYRFSKAATPRQIAERLIQGDVYFYSITIPEGLTAHEIVGLMAKNGLGNRAEMEQDLLNTDWIADLDPKARSLEGYLFPETYHFKRKSDSATIIRAMINQFRQKVSSILSSHPLQPGWDIPKVVILASMIEKEVKRPEEGPLVASVLVNRLEKGMPLGCDATIIYAMKLAGTYEGRLGKADLAMKSPYNSYRHQGLPPGPIANPGANALQSALNPARTDYYYYVSRNDGTHQFSRDLRSHNRAVDIFQKSLAHRR